MCSEAAKIAKGDQEPFKIGYLHGDMGSEFQRALELFSERHPDAPVSITHGNHEELYGLLLTGQVDLILNDQRRAFSNAYVNLILTTCQSLVEVPTRSPLAQMEALAPQDLKNFPCILVASEPQRETEQAYYRDVIGFQGEFLFAETLEEAWLLVISRKGVLPVEGTGTAVLGGTSITRISLVRDGTPILRSYCAFWKKNPQSAM